MADLRAAAGDPAGKRQRQLFDVARPLGQLQSARYRGQSSQNIDSVVAQGVDVLDSVVLRVYIRNSESRDNLLDAAEALEEIPHCLE